MSDSCECSSAACSVIEGDEVTTCIPPGTRASKSSLALGFTIVGPIMGFQAYNPYMCPSPDGKHATGVQILNEVRSIPKQVPGNRHFFILAPANPVLSRNREICLLQLVAQRYICRFLVCCIRFTLSRKMPLRRAASAPDCTRLYFFPNWGIIPRESQSSRMWCHHMDG